MIYKFNAYAHPNILGIHKTTLEFTKDKKISLKGDCIVGINADFDLSKIKEFIKKARNKEIEIIIQPIPKFKIKETISAELNPNFNSNNELIIRKTNFISERTFAINSNKASFDLNRDLIRFLREKKNKISVLLNTKEWTN